MGQEEARDGGDSEGARISRFPALRSRDFRLLWIGQAISVIGSQMQVSAIRWHIYGLTDSYVALGLIGLFRLLPVIAFSMLGGAVADVWDRRRILLVTQSALAITAAILAVMTWSGHISAAAMYTMMVVGAAAMSFDNPARQSLVPNLVPREHFANATSLNSMAMQVASIVGPTLAGLLIGRGLLAATYALNALSFLAVIAALLLIRPQSMAREPDERGSVSWGALVEGLRFVWRSPILVSTIAVDFLATFFSSANSLLPVFARDVLKAGASGYGVLSAAPSVGSLVTGAVMALLPRIRRQGRTMLAAVAVYGLATVVFGASHTFWVTWLALAATGAADTVSTILRQTIRQMVTPDRLRGRMTAVNMVFFMGGPQLGNLEAGLAAQWLGPAWSVITGGLGCLLSVAWVGARTPALRRYDGEH